MDRDSGAGSNSDHRAIGLAKSKDRSYALFRHGANLFDYNLFWTIETDDVYELRRIYVLGEPGYFSSPYETPLKIKTRPGTIETGIDSEDF